MVVEKVVEVVDIYHFRISGGATWPKGSGDWAKSGCFRTVPVYLKRRSKWFGTIFQVAWNNIHIAAERCSNGCGTMFRWQQNGIPMAVER